MPHALHPPARPRTGPAVPGRRDRSCWPGPGTGVNAPPRYAAGCLRQRDGPAHAASSPFRSATGPCHRPAGADGPRAHAGPSRWPGVSSAQAAGLLCHLPRATGAGSGSG
ncbi:hypothetical protein G6F24_017591 [Rhizopus arrhizus]|nr:hypothetical protein G6F24_017591 [Rhizopus arrhizus]